VGHREGDEVGETGRINQIAVVDEVTDRLRERKKFSL
jgi:hypothetical protein